MGGRTGGRLYVRADGRGWAFLDGDVVWEEVVRASLEPAWVPATRRQQFRHVLTRARWSWIDLVVCSAIAVLLSHLT